MKEICYWSVGDGNYAPILQSLVNSFHDVGMTDDFYAISDRQIDGAYTYIYSNYPKKHFLFKFNLLSEILFPLKYQYYVFLDADCLFLRKPDTILSVMQGSPIHACLESDLTSPLALEKKGQWKNCPLPVLVSFMRELGVKSQRIYSLNGGFFIVKRDVIKLVCSLAYLFWSHSMVTKDWAYRFTEEPLLAYAVQKLCGDPDLHTLRRHPDLWATDWTGHFADKPPTDSEWIFEDYLTGETFPVRPAIIHAIKSKDYLRSRGIRSPL